MVFIKNPVLVIGTGFSIREYLTKFQKQTLHLLHSAFLVQLFLHSKTLSYPPQVILI
jgi:hypothetical protein